MLEQNGASHTGGNAMQQPMHEMGWMMGAHAILWALAVVALVLAIAALIKYLRK
jgi:hypothetical protein